MIHIVLFGIVGELGAGKTLTLTYLAWKHWFTRRETIYSNYHLYKIPYVYIDGFDKLDVIRNGFLCFPPDQLVICNPSVKEISKINVGDKVLTDDGTYKEVEKTFTNKYHGIIVKIKTKKFNLDIKATPNHPILIAQPKIDINFKRHNNTKWSVEEDLQLMKNKIYSNELNYKIDKNKKTCISRLFKIKKRVKIHYDYQWKAIYDIDKNDLMTYPIHKQESIKKIDKKSCIYCHNKKLSLRGYTKDKKRRYQCNKCKKSFIERYLNVNNVFDYENNDFCYLLGLFFADGNANQQVGKVRFYIEKKLVKNVSNKIEKLFNIKPKIYKRDNFYSVEFYSTKISRIFHGYGKRKYKNPPIEILNIPNKYSDEFLKGYFDGNGYIKHNYPKKYKIYKINTVSPSMVYIITQLLLRKGIIPSVSKVLTKPYHFNNKKTKISEQYRITYTKIHNLKGILDNNKLLLPIENKKSEKYNGLVHNMEVKDNHTYALPNSIVHNCMDELWLIADARTSRSTKNRLTANILARSRKRSLTIAFTAQVIGSVDNRIRQVVDFLSYPILSANETFVKAVIFRGSKAYNGAYMKTLYFQTDLFKQCYDTEEEIEMEETSDNPLRFCFQENRDAEPQFFNTWKEADKVAEKYWLKNYKNLKNLI